MMSYCKKFGKDKVVFTTKEDHQSSSKLEEADTSSKVSLSKIEESPGLFLPSGEINWNCPCLGGMASGPCGIQFKDAFTCFLNSKADPKGADCIDAFKLMQGCMVKYPEIYNKKSEDKVEDKESSAESGVTKVSEKNADKPVASTAANIT